MAHEGARRARANKAQSARRGDIGFIAAHHTGLTGPCKGAAHGAVRSTGPMIILPGCVNFEIGGGPVEVTDSGDADGIRARGFADAGAANQRAFSDRLMDNAIHGLDRCFPGESAGQGLTRAQRTALTLIFAGLCISLFLAPIPALHFLAAIATLFFALVVALRLIACINLTAALPREWLRRSPARIASAELPVYTILVPLFRECAVLAGLTRALTRLDYPALGSKRTKAI